jgi:hypothetical protein
MKITFLGLILTTMVVTPVLAEPLYSIHIKGPVVIIEFSCDDPCDVAELNVVGHAGGGLTSTEVDGNKKQGSPSARENAQSGVKCKGTCGKSEQSITMVFETERTLREGFELTISDSQAHFILYSVTETEQGQATRRQHSQFRIDRSLIELELHDHDVTIRTEMTDSKKTPDW